jgi:hypothetical protein
MFGVTAQARTVPADDAFFNCTFHEPKEKGNDQDRCQAVGAFDARMPAAGVTRIGDQDDRFAVECDGKVLFNDGIDVLVSPDGDDTGRIADTFFFAPSGTPAVHVDDLDWNTLTGTFNASLRVNIPGEGLDRLVGTCEFTRTPPRR